MYMSVGAPRDQKKVLDPLELDLQTVLSCLLWMLGTILRSSGRAANSPAHIRRVYHCFSQSSPIFASFIRNPPKVGWQRKPFCVRIKY